MDEGLKLKHFGVRDRGRVIDQNPDVHLGITFTTGRLSNGSGSGSETGELEVSTVGQLGGTDHGGVGDEIGQKLCTLGRSVSDSSWAFSA